MTEEQPLRSAFVAASRDQSLVVVHRLLTSVASLVAEQRALGAPASVLVVRGLSSRSSQAPEHGSVAVTHGFRRSTACGIFLDWGSNPCLLHWQVAS